MDLLPISRSGSWYEEKINRVPMKGVSFVPLNTERKWAFHLVIASLICIFLVATSLNLGIFSSLPTINSLFFSRFSTKRADPAFVEQGLSRPLGPPADPPLPRFAYLISGSKGDLEKLWRTLQSLYHPLNQYVAHLDLESSLEERLELASRVEREPIFSKLGNVYVIKKANMVTYTGPTMASNTLHACAILLKRSQEWDWFINLSASNYPLVTQDDLIYTFSKLNRSLNFIEHASNLDWKEGQRAMPLIIDPGLYSTTKSDIFFVEPKRSLPTALSCSL
ncbi:Beta-glucuronosyltransferase GlcAT14B-like protein, partial [Drosera capensis]